jgi:hypothetical protein
LCLTNLPIYQPEQFVTAELSTRTAALGLHDCEAGTPIGSMSGCSAIPLDGNFSSASFRHNFALSHDC